MLNTWKSIAVVLDASAESQRTDGVGDYAARLAHRDNAHLIGIFSLGSIAMAHQTDTYVKGEEAMRAVIERIQAEREQATVKAARQLADLARRHDVISELRITAGRDAEDEATLHALHCDLVIVGHPKPPSMPDRWSPERLLFAAGVPVLIVPEPVRSDAIVKRVLIAWNASLEARRAVTDAMPFIVNAEAVTVLVVDADKESGRHGKEPGADIALFLARHGAKVEVLQASSLDGSVAQAILSHVENHHVDLIVIGAYSHSRATQWILGGVTRTMLAQVHTPLLISR
jgi:nucleotide-binding universal stress UspA family protein